MLPLLRQNVYFKRKAMQTEIDVTPPGVVIQNKSADSNQTAGMLEEDSHDTLKKLLIFLLTGFIIVITYSLQYDLLDVSLTVSAVKASLVVSLVYFAVEGLSQFLSGIPP